MKKLIMSTKTSAQGIATACHNRLVAHNPAYADSVNKGHTTAWSIPQEDGTYDTLGNFTPSGAGWYIWVRVDLSPVDPTIAALFPQPAI